jgi:hypothetical protein
MQRLPKGPLTLALSPEGRGDAGGAVRLFPHVMSEFEWNKQHDRNGPDHFAG